MHRSRRQARADMALLEIRGLTKSFGGVRAVSDFDFTADKGEVVSVIGPNGAGKTTVFNLVSGMIPPDAGEVFLGGRDIVGLRPNRILHLGIARTFQAVRLFPEMTVRENVMVARHARSRSGVFAAVLRTPSFRREEEEIRRVAEDTLAFFGRQLLGSRLDELALALSFGDRRRLEIARALASEPRILLLDEPTAGMDPRERQELTQLVGRIRDEHGLAVVLIEHDMRVVKGVSDRVVVLDYGEKIAEGPYDEVAENPRVIEAYLGREEDR
jgi:branched-chain amino acid transport system ATP-binding protein